MFWLASVRPDGRPHVTPLIAVWLAGRLYFCTGESERKATNLAHNVHCVITTGANTLHEGFDLVIEGDAVRATGDSQLQPVAEQYAAKYDWHDTVRYGAFSGDGGNLVLVYAVTPTTVFGFGKGEPFSQTRGRF